MLLVNGQDTSTQKRLSVELTEVESRFVAELISDLTCVNTLVSHVERYRGKMLRPMLVLLAGLATAKPEDGGPASGDNGDDANDDAGLAPQLNDAHRVVATVVEMVHMATLVHDDVLDEADVRRRGTTVNALNGNEAAVMLGDYLISHAYHLCSSLDRPLISRLIADTTNTVCEGELLQLANRNNWRLDEGTYFEIIRRKTASLTGMCCKLGAMLHDEHDETIAEALYDYGELVGTAFQVVDDLLDLVGDQATVGKSLGRDLAKGKLTLPLIRYLATAGDDDREQTLATIRSVTHDDEDETEIAVADVRRRVTESDAIDYSRNVAADLIARAKSHLTALPDSTTRTLLADMADAVLTRKS